MLDRTAMLTSAATLAQRLTGRWDKCLLGGGCVDTSAWTLPDFLGIGAQKAGTTWLHANLSRQPQLFLPPQKEVHYFDLGYHLPLRDYAAIFEPGRGKIKGELTPRYALLPSVRIRLIQRIMPKVKLIFILRNPMERAWSQAVMNLATQRQRQVQQVSRQEFLDHFRSPGSLARGMYSRILERWERYFAPSQWFIGLFESISQRPEALLDALLSFLGAPPPANYQDYPLRQIIRKGDGPPLPEPYRQVLTEMYEHELRKLQARYGDAIRAWRDQ